MTADNKIGISFFGAGNIGSTVLKRLAEMSDEQGGALRDVVSVRHVLVRDLDRTEREEAGFFVEPDLLTTDVADILKDDDTQIVVELMGGEQPAYDYISEALKAGKHVVTANKAVLAKFGDQLFSAAARSEVHLQFEASVGGGIPVISALRRDLAANEISSIEAIINGTTNFILTKMGAGDDYETALTEAGRLGYAEPDPSADVDGHDAVAKSVILAMLAYGAMIHPESVVSEGIRNLVSADVSAASELGYVIKLLARLQSENGEISVSVLPTLVGKDTQLGNVSGVTNAVEFTGDLVGKLFYEGPGAGREATTSAVIADLLEVINDQSRGIQPAPLIQPHPVQVKPSEEIESGFFLRLIVENRPGVLAEISRILAQASISISSVVQKDIAGQETASSVPDSAELILTTHSSQRGSVLEAVAVLGESKSVLQIGSVLPMSR